MILSCNAGFEALSGFLSPVTAVTGHYGVGKTNFALNVALDAARTGEQVTLVDLDVVNPYFRSTEYRALLEDAGVTLVAPVFAEAGGSLDVPSLTGAVAGAVERAQTHGGLCLIDAGGDDVGATALGRFAHAIARDAYAMLYVVNAYRNLTHTPLEAQNVLREIERAAGLRATALVSNAHLKGDTDVSAVVHGVELARAAASETGLPLACATVPKSLFRLENDALSARVGEVSLYAVDVHVKAPWE